jgi:hypothetical protein
MNLVARVALVGLPALVVLGGGVLAYAWGWSDWYTKRNNPVEQPVPFSHKHHVSGLGIDCRYCHTGVEDSGFAGLPSTETCATCHSEIWVHAPMLAPIRESWNTRTRLKWNRVYDLPDYVYFDHSIHISKGVGCSTCHGDVGQMPLTQKMVDMQMRWCLDCHQEPEKHLRPAEGGGAIFDTGWTEPPDQLEVGRRLVEKNHVQKYELTNCSICHR